MHVACRLAGLSPLETYYAGIVMVTQAGLVDDRVAQPRGSLEDGSGCPPSLPGSPVAPEPRKPPTTGFPAGFGP
jgi:hypothetical protein